MREQYEAERNTGHRTFATDHSYDEWLAEKGRQKQLAEIGYYPSTNQVAIARAERWIEEWLGGLPTTPVRRRAAVNSLAALLTE
jgi:hypothetical protein